MWIDTQSSSLVHDYGPTVISFVVYTVSGLWFLRAHSKEVGTREASLAGIVEWKEDHEREGKQRDEQLNALRVIAAASQATAKAQGDQLALMQQELRDYRLQLLRRKPDDFGL